MHLCVREARRRGRRVNLSTSPDLTHVTAVTVQAATCIHVYVSRQQQPHSLLLSLSLLSSVPSHTNDMAFYSLLSPDIVSHQTSPVWLNNRRTWGEEE